MKVYPNGGESIYGVEGINGLKIEEGIEGVFISHRAVINSAATTHLLNRIEYFMIGGLINRAHVISMGVSSAVYVLWCTLNTPHAVHGSRPILL